MIRTARVWLLGGALAMGVLGATQARAQSFQVGAHVGALGTTDSTVGANIGYGIHFLVNPLGWAALQLDTTFAHYDSAGAGFYFGSAPALVLYPLDFTEMKLGILFGPGFHKFSNDSLRFGLNMGLSGEFAVSDEIIVGMQGRYHPVFGTTAAGTSAPDIWSVFMTVAYRWEGGGGW